MQKKENVSMSVIRRLPRYYRFLSELNKIGKTRTSSKELSVKMGFTASQIRQDFNCFGGFGQQGYGYNIPQLCLEIENILGIQNLHKCILIGAGNLGNTIITHMEFEKLGFQLTGVFDNNQKLVGKTINGHEILYYDDIGGFIKANKPEMAILCIPRSAVESIVNELYALGVKSYWNFSHFDISMVYSDTIVENVHLNDSMMTLCYKLNEAGYHTVQ